MKFLKLIPTILKNLGLIIFDETRNMLRRIGYGKSVIIIVLIVALGGGWYWWKERNSGLTPEDTLTMKEAAKMGDVTTHKLLVQIENPKGNPEDIKGRYQRGDIVMAAPGDREFSDAEKSGFLIIKMDLTDKQGELLMRPQEKILDEKDESGERRRESVARRKFAVDLKKIGIADDVQRGREVSDVYKWEGLIIEKEAEED